MAEHMEKVVEVEVPKKIFSKRKKTALAEPEPGIVYFSRIPPYMSVKKIRQVFEAYGEIGRVFLQPDSKTPSHKKSRLFTEGWIEFLNKKVAKRTALLLNNTQIGGKKRSRWYSEIWNLKYLPRFKWGHLNERLAYERAVHQQRLRTEISQVKKETNFYIQNVEKRKILDKVEKREKAKGGELKRRKWEFTQKDTEEEILRRKTNRESSKDDDKTASKQSAPERTKPAKKAKRKQDKVSLEAKKAASDKHFLKNLFSGGLADDDN